MVLVLLILEYMYLLLDFKCTYISVVSVVHSGVPVFTPCFKCSCIGGVSVLHSGAPVLAP